MLIEIYTKTNCNFCNQSKMFLKNKGISYVEREIVSEVVKEELLQRTPHVKTVPQIFIDNAHIGGYTELVEFFKKIDEKVT